MKDQVYNSTRSGRQDVLNLARPEMPRFGKPSFKVPFTNLKDSAATATKKTPGDRVAQAPPVTPTSNKRKRTQQERSTNQKKPRAGDVTTPVLNKRKRGQQDESVKRKKPRADDVTIPVLEQDGPVSDSLGLSQQVMPLSTSTLRQNSHVQETNRTSTDLQSSESVAAMSPPTTPLQPLAALDPSEKVDSGHVEEHLKNVKRPHELFTPNTPKTDTLPTPFSSRLRSFFARACRGRISGPNTPSKQPQDSGVPNTAGESTKKGSYDDEDDEDYLLSEDFEDDWDVSE